MHLEKTLVREIRLHGIINVQLNDKFYSETQKLNKTEMHMRVKGLVFQLKFIPAHFILLSFSSLSFIRDLYIIPQNRVPILV